MNTISFNVPATVLDLGNQHLHSDRQEMAMKSFTFLVAGTSRLVFDLGDAVLKVAIRDAGIAQNKQEASPVFEPYYDKTLVPVLTSHDAGYWLIQKKAVPIHQNFPKVKKGELARLASRANRIAKLFQMDANEMIDPQNIGFIDGKLLILDYGMSQHIADQYYAKQRARW